MDFKGWFRTGDGQRCDPFTITDSYSRYLIGRQAITRMDTAHVRAICEAAMREFGVPEHIRTDNGSPFSGTVILGLTFLVDVFVGWAGKLTSSNENSRLNRSLTRSRIIATPSGMAQPRTEFANTQLYRIGRC